MMHRFVDLRFFDLRSVMEPAAHIGSCVAVPFRYLLLACGVWLTAANLAISAEPEGQVNIFVDASSGFDSWTSSPSEEDQQFMRDHYYRMQVYAPYFDSRLDWYPMAWEYKDAYAIYTSSTLASEHPEWILKGASGENLYIPFGCSGGSCPQYAADIGNPDFQSAWIEAQRANMNAGYIGIWIDDVNLSRITVGNGNGNSVTPVDPRTGEEMTLSNWRRYFAEFMERVSAEFPDHEIVHNVHWWADRDDPYVVRQLEAADWINIERGITDSGIRRGTGTYGFESMLGFIDWMHARGIQVAMDDDDDSGERERDYELAFYLLINNGMGDVLGTDGNRSRIYPDQFWSGYLVDLGYAEGDRYQWNGLFRRDFECGIVLVNQPESSDVTVDLPETLVDLSGASVDRISLLASSGQVLANPSCVPGGAPEPPTNLSAN